MADIFLSYASQDVGRITRLVDVLEQQGWSVWWDHKIRIGKSFDHIIEEEIAKAKCILVLWSQESVRSDWVKSEAAEGKKRHILAPVLIDNLAIPLEFRRTEAAKLYDWKGDLPHPELKLLLHAIGEIVGQPSTSLDLTKAPRGQDQAHARADQPDLVPTKRSRAWTSPLICGGMGIVSGLISAFFLELPRKSGIPSYLVFALDQSPGIVFGAVICLFGEYTRSSPTRIWKRIFSFIVLTTASILGWYWAEAIGASHRSIGVYGDFFLAGAVGGICITAAEMLCWRLSFRRWAYLLIIVTVAGIAGSVGFLILTELGTYPFFAFWQAAVLSAHVVALKITSERARSGFV